MITPTAEKVNHQFSPHATTNRVVPLHVAGRDKPVAFVHIPKRLLFKTVDGRKHFVKVPPGIAFDDDVLKQASDLGATDIEVTDGNTGDVYRTPLDTFLHHAEVVNRGFGRQLALRFAYWRKNGQMSEIERLAEIQAARAEAAAAKQMTLWEVQR